MFPCLIYISNPGYSVAYHIAIMMAIFVFEYVPHQMSKCSQTFHGDFMPQMPPEEAEYFSSDFTIVVHVDGYFNFSLRFSLLGIGFCKGLLVLHVLVMIIAIMMGHDG